MGAPISWRVVTSQSRAVPFPLAVASIVPSWLNAAAAVAGPAAGPAVGAVPAVVPGPAVIGVPICRWVATLHKLASPLAATVARILPLGLNATACGSAAGPLAVIGSPVSCA